MNNMEQSAAKRKEKLRTVIAFTALGLLLITGLILTGTDTTDDVYPTEDTKIRLYGEAHGYKPYYEIELELWQECYALGYRNLFVELPYYSAEFLNEWMKEDSDEIIDELFEDIRNTLSGNEHYKTFFRKIKSSCPETVFFGTDVGHQYDTTGARYLKHLENNGRKDSLQYALAEKCIRQGEEYAKVHSDSGISQVRESYMISNFVDAYDRCGGKIMGIYGSYHTHLNDSDLMAGKLKEHYGDIFSSVQLSTLAMEQKPYRIGFCVTGLIFLLMLYIPNIIWAKKGMPEGYQETAGKENRLLLLLERAGEVGMTCALLLFPALDPCVKKLPEGLFFGNRILFWLLAVILMILYECYWISYFKSPRKMEDFYSSYAGFPVAGATLPVLAALILGLYAQNWIVIAVSVILGIGHIGIHLMHRRETLRKAAC